jgi:2EXR family
MDIKFPQFARLPPELRKQVWTATLPTSRIWKLQYQPHWPGRFNLESEPVAAMGVSREAREVASYYHFEAAFGGHVDFIDDQFWMTGHSMNGFCFSQGQGSQVTFLASVEIKPWISQFLQQKKEDLMKIRRLVVDLAMLQMWANMTSKERPGFGDLAELSLLLPEEGCKLFGEIHVFVLAYAVVEKMCDLGISASVYKVRVEQWVEQWTGRERICCGEVVTKEREQVLVDAQAKFGLKNTELVQTAMQKTREAAVGALCWTSCVMVMEDSSDED